MISKEQLKNKYFAYSGKRGFDTYQTLDLAKEAADDDLEFYREVASDYGWDDPDSLPIYYGEITNTPSPDKGEKVYFDGELVDSVEFKFVDKEPTPTQQLCRIVELCEELRKTTGISYSYNIEDGDVFICETRDSVGSYTYFSGNYGLCINKLETALDKGGFE